MFRRIEYYNEGLLQIKDTGDIDDFGDNIPNVIEEYCGTRVFTCYHCKDDIYMTDNALEKENEW